MLATALSLGALAGCGARTALSDEPSWTAPPTCPAAFAAPPPNPRHASFAVGAGRAVMCGAGIVSVAADGARVELSKDRCSAPAVIAADDEHAYWVSDTCAVRRAPIDGRGPSETLASFDCEIFESAQPVSLALTRTRVLVLMLDAGPYSVRSLPKDAAGPAASGSFSFDAPFIAGDDEELFGFRWDGDGNMTLVGAPFGAPAQRLVASPVWHSVDDDDVLDVDETHAYVLRRLVTAPKVTQIVRVPRSGGDLAIVDETAPSAPIIGLRVDARWLYSLEWRATTDYAADLVARPKAGGAARVLARCPYVYGGLTVDATHVYFATGEGIHRVPRP